MDICEKCWGTDMATCDSCLGPCREDSKSSSLACSTAWISVEDKLPQHNQFVLAYKRSGQPVTSFHALRWWHGDELEYTHWFKLEPPK